MKKMNGAIVRTVGEIKAAQKEIVNADIPFLSSAIKTALSAKGSFRFFGPTRANIEFAHSRYAQAAKRGLLPSTAPTVAGKAYASAFRATCVLLFGF